MGAQLPRRVCLYCGTPTRKGGRGEHIIPAALGGKVTLNDRPTRRAVCEKCNSGVLSQIDKELSSRSFLSFVASQQIAGHMWQVWDVDHACGHLLVEARPAWAEDEAMNSLVCFPQITFDHRGAQVRGDAKEFERFGQDDAMKVLFKAVRECFNRWCKTGFGLHFERIDSGVIKDGYRFLPRIFTSRPIAEIAENVRNQSFTIRYVTEADKRLALNSLSKLGEYPKLSTWTKQRGSHYPTISHFFDVADTLRALMKIGLNLIAAYCIHTPVNHQRFAEAVSIIRGEKQMLPLAMQRNGFVHAGDLDCIKAGDRDHAFRLMHQNGEWHVYSSFFGGRVGAFVRVPGPNWEDWKCADIVAPIGSKDWKDSTSPLLRVMRPRVTWNGALALPPNLILQRSSFQLRVETHQKKRSKVS